MNGSDRTLAPPGTTLGKLQRGRGAGWLEACAGPRSETHALLLDCIVSDPIGALISPRAGDDAEYYATLAVAVDFPADLLEPLLLQEQPGDDLEERSDATYLVTDMLNEMARRGRRDAVAVLRRYAEQGVAWTFVVDDLLELGEDLEGLGEAIAARYPDPDSLDEALSYNGPWERDANGWRRLHPRIAASVDRLAAIEEERRRQRRVPVPPADLSTEELLRREKGHQVLRGRRSVHDQQLMARALLNGSRGERNNAVQALRLIRPLNLAAVQTLIQGVRDGHERRARMVISHSAGPDVLPLARQWASDSNEDVAAVGAQLIFKHGTADELPWMRSQAQRARDTGHIYGTWDAVKAFGRLRDAASTGTLEAVIQETPFALARQDAAEALNSIDPLRFAQAYATESLWDCEYRMRTLGCATAPLSPQVHARLVQLTNDPLEGAKVRKAAAARIGVDA